MDLAKVFRFIFFPYILWESESQKLFSKSHHSCSVAFPTSFVFVCLAYWIDVKFDWITKFEIDAGFDNYLASLTSCKYTHTSHRTLSSKSFVVHFANVFQNRQCIKCQIQLLMHPRQNYKQKQFKHVENEASNEKFIGWVIKCHFTS